MEVTDKFGHLLQIGDNVIYACGGMADLGLYIGKITNLVGTNAIVAGEDIRDKEQQKYSWQLIYFGGYKQQNPELFI